MSAHHRRKLVSDRRYTRYSHSSDGNGVRLDKGGDGGNAQADIWTDQFQVVR